MKAKITCKKCGLPIHSEVVKRSTSRMVTRDYVHDNYKEAWKVDEKGYAHALHFAVPEDRGWIK